MTRKALFSILIIPFLCSLSYASTSTILIDPIYPTTFKHANEDRFFPMGDTAYFLMGESESDINAFIDSRRAQRFNFIRVGVLCPGFWPLNGTPENPEISWNISVVSKLDNMFTYADSKGMYIELIFWLYGNEGGEAIWGNTANENAYIDLVVNRYKSRTNLFMWTIANEFERYPDGKYVYSESDVTWAKAKAARIRVNDQTHPISVHCSHWTSETPPYNSYKVYSGTSQTKPQVVWPLWATGDVNVFNVQNNWGVQPYDWVGVKATLDASAFWEGVTYAASYTSQGWNFEWPGGEDSVANDVSHGKPVIVTEFGYQYETGESSSSQQIHTQATTRKKMWKIITAGGYFATGFMRTIFEFAASDISAWINEGYGRQYRILYDYVTSNTAWWRMSPNHSLVASYNSCLALVGTEYLAYFPRGGTNMVNISPGTYGYTWLNPRTGAISSGRITASGGNHSFTAPGSEDWVLHLKLGFALK